MGYPAIGKDRRYDEGEMKTHPAPHVPGNTEAERMDAAVRKMFSVPKEAVLREEARQKAENDKKRAKSKKHD